MSMGPSHVTFSLSNISKEIAKKSGNKAKVSVQKIYHNWSDIIGDEFADKCIPVHVSWSRYQSKKSNAFSSRNFMPTGGFEQNKKTKDQNDKNQKGKTFSGGATLHIATSSSIATRLMYQEHLILERLARILGHYDVKAVQIKHESGLDNAGHGYKIPKKLSKAQVKEVEDMLSHIEDRALKERLQSMGEKILLDQQR